MSLLHRPLDRTRREDLQQGCVLAFLSSLEGMRPCSHELRGDVREAPLPSQMADDVFGPLTKLIAFLYAYMKGKRESHLREIESILECGSRKPGRHKSNFGRNVRTSKTG